MNHAHAHVPVLAERIVELLAPALSEPGAVYVDCTLGMAGHAEAILTRCPQARLIGIDRDADALAYARERLAPLCTTAPASASPLSTTPPSSTAPPSTTNPGVDRIRLFQAVYDELPDVLAEAGTPKVQGLLLDLGLSSLQIDRRERGFSYAVDSPLDMRMDARQPRTAADVINTYAIADLTRILRTYGEERFADRIARAVVTERAIRPFTDSARLVEVIAAAIPAAARYAGGHPAKRTFQALRIEVNRELEALEAVLPAALAALAKQGRIAVLAYHSLEDRLVKQAFRDASEAQVPRGLPVIPAGMEPQFTLLTRGAERPGEAEVTDNPRAASARLRAAIRTEEQR